MYSAAGPGGAGRSGKGELSTNFGMSIVVQLRKASESALAKATTRTSRQSSPVHSKLKRAMFISRTLRAVSGLPASLARLLPGEAKEALANKPRKLYETLSRLPKDGVGARVYQTRWQSKGIEGCYWEVSRTKLRKEGTRGEAWGRLVWRGAFALLELLFTALIHELREAR